MGSREHGEWRSGGAESLPPARLRIQAARRALAQGAAPWFALTRDEQKALLLVMSLFALGLAVRWWMGRG